MSIGQCRETPPYFFRHQSTVNTHDPTREASPGFTMHRIVHMQCRGDWKVARVSIWRACAAVLCMRCVYFGRASTRPYSYAMRPGFCNALNCAYMQCRGDWKVARVSTGRVCAAIPLAGEMYALRVFRASFHSPLQLRDEALPVFYNALNCTYMQRIGDEALSVFCIVLNCTYMQCPGGDALRCFTLC